VALSGHRLTVTHTDGYPVMPAEVDALLIGMGERYDVITTVGDGVFPLVAAGEGKKGLGRALLITGSGAPPPADFSPAELRGHVGRVDQFFAAPGVTLPVSSADKDLPVDLGGSMMNYDWTINGLPFSRTRPLTVRGGQRITMTLNNTTTMWHPMHLHGHTFQMLTSGGLLGARKDTVIVLPRQKLTVAFDADNPGKWMLHCHNTYHQEAGMMTTLNYVT
jgi:FtsP/CotA-like multicopper oxidase with cupredoxin domain